MYYTIPLRRDSHNSSLSSDVNVLTLKRSEDCIDDVRLELCSMEMVVDVNINKLRKAVRTVSKSKEVTVVVDHGVKVCRSNMYSDEPTVEILFVKREVVVLLSSLMAALDAFIEDTIDID